MATIYEWPDLLTPKRIKFNISPRSRSGGASISGQEQVVASGAGIWTATLGEIPVVTPQQVRMMRALATLLQGKVGMIRVPCYDALQAPWPVVNGVPQTEIPPQPHGDNTFFSDGSGYHQTQIVVRARAAAAGASQITVDVERAGAIQDGNRFSIGNRLYGITFVSPGPDAGSLVLQVFPPLRDAVATGDVCNFDRPVCLMRLATDSELDIDLDLGRWDNPTVSMIEFY